MWFSIRSPFGFYAKYLLKTEGHLRACNEALKYGAEILWYFNCNKFGDKYYLGLVLGRKYGERYIEAFNKKDEDFFLEVKEESDKYIKRFIDRYDYYTKVINNSKKEYQETISSKESYPYSISEGIPNQRKRYDNSMPAYNLGISEGIENAECTEGRKDYKYTFKTGGGFLRKSKLKTITLDCLSNSEIAQIKVGIADLNKLKNKANSAQFANALNLMRNAIQTSTMRRTINGLQYQAGMNNSGPTILTPSHGVHTPSYMGGF